MLVYLAVLETEQEKTKFEQLYLTYRQTMFHVANSGPHGEYFKDRVSPNEKLCGYYSKEHCDQFV